MFRRIAILMIVLVLPAATAAAQSLLVDKLLAVMGNSTITAGSVEVEKKIQQYADDSLLYPGQGRQLTNKQVLHELMVRELILGQSVKMGSDEIPEKLLDAALDRFASAFGSPGHYLRFLISIEYADPRFDKKMESNVQWVHFSSMRNRFKKVLLARQFIDRKVGLNIKLVLASRFADQRDQLAAQHPGVSEEELKKILLQQLYQKGVEEWVRDVASRTRIVILDSTYADVLP